jgi:arylformamidase
MILNAVSSHADRQIHVHTRIGGVTELKINPPFQPGRRVFCFSAAMIYDITPLVSERLQIWPGDTPLTRQVLCDLQNGDSLTLSTLHATVHLGAHADAPSHYGRNAPAIHERSLDYYLGPCQVIRVLAAPRTCVPRDAIKVPILASRVLLTTSTYPDPDHFNDDFAALAPELVDWLHHQGVILIGIDTPSVDLFDSQDLPAHRRFLRHDMSILEGLVLKDVPEGVYELIALPLRLAGFDASPVRAILRTIPNSSG